MKIYQVGGAVRDEILGIKAKDIDYVVINATEQDLLGIGYYKIGKSFPVFINPENKCEYALARKEVKIGNKHTDFTVISNPEVSLYEDSFRRDFTCNAIYKDENTGQLIDFYKGMQDIKNKCLRHISDCFSEDALRVLRMCRFSAQLNFDVAPETMDLCKKMVEKEQLKYLSKDRIWLEFDKAISCAYFYKFVEASIQCGAFSYLLPEFDTNKIRLNNLKNNKTNNKYVNFCLLFNDYSDEQIKSLVKLIKAPKEYIKFLQFIKKYQGLDNVSIIDNRQKYVDFALCLAHFSSKKYWFNYMAVSKALGDDEFICFENNINNLLQTIDRIKFNNVNNYLNLSPDELKERYVDLVIKNTEIII